MDDREIALECQVEMNYAGLSFSSLHAYIQNPV